MTYEQKLQKAKRKAEIVKEKQNIENIITSLIFFKLLPPF